MNDQAALPVHFSFPPIENKTARCLILGSMPGAESLRQQQYYAHPRNAFWPIMSALFAIDSTLPYNKRCNMLAVKQIAIWDVLQACKRRGSLDQHIESDSLVANDFNSFLYQHQQIQHIFFNGTKAEQLFKQYVMPKLDDALLAIPRTRLPSTSPAHAAMKQQEKLQRWQQALASFC